MARKTTSPWALLAGGRIGEAALQRQLAARRKAEKARKRQDQKGHPLQPLQGSRYDPGQAPQITAGGPYITTRSSRPDRRSY